MEQLTISEKREGIGVVESSVHRKLANGMVSVSMITAERRIDTRSVSKFVENGGGLILAMASAGDWWEVVEAGAVDDEVLRRKSVCKDAGLAFSIGIITSVAGHSAASRARLSSNCLQTFGDLSNGPWIGGMEIFLKFAGVLAGNSGSSSGKAG